MTEDLLDFWVRLIRPFFPANAWIVARYAGEDHLIELDWKLDDDPERPNRRSRKIQITISEEAVEQYLDKDKKEREQFETSLKKLINERFNRPGSEPQVREGSSASADKLRIGRGTLDP